MVQRFDELDALRAFFARGDFNNLARELDHVEVVAVKPLGVNRRVGLLALARKQDVFDVLFSHGSFQCNLVFEYNATHEPHRIL